MASIYELVTLSGMAYDSTRTTFANWERIDKHGYPFGYGFYAELYKNIERKEAVIAIRGTDGGDKDWSDFRSDLQIGLGQIPSQLKDANKAYEHFLYTTKFHLGDIYNLYLTGHSLGGGLASLLSAKHNGLPTVTFNAPGMLRSYLGGYLINLIGYFRLQSVDTSQMKHIRATGDVVSLASGTHMGKVQTVYVDHWGDDKIMGTSRYLAQHSINNMVSTIKTSGSYRNDLGYKANKAHILMT